MMSAFLHIGVPSANPNQKWNYLNFLLRTPIKTNYLMKRLLPKKEQHHMQSGFSVTEISHWWKDKEHGHSERFSNPGEAIGPLNALFSP